jgi:hypothetical protein
VIVAIDTDFEKVALSQDKSEFPIIPHTADLAVKMRFEGLIRAPNATKFRLIGGK